MRNTELEEAQAGIKIARRNINNLRYADYTTLMAESEEEINSLLMKVKSESDVAQSFPTLRDPMVCSLPGSSVCGIFHAGVGCHCLLWQVKEESEKVGLKFNIQKTKTMASGPITSWEINEETVSDFIFWAPKSLQMVTAAMKLKDTYSLEEKL